MAINAHFAEFLEFVKESDLDQTDVVNLLLERDAQVD
jgi:hypothetical protein